MNTETQLTTVSNKLLPNEQLALLALNDEHKKYIVAKYGNRKVQDIPEASLKLELHTIVAKMIGDYNPKDLKDSMLQKFCTEALFGELRGALSVLTIQEISNAISMGVRNEFGDWFGFSGVTFNLWLKGYLADQRRLDAIKKFNQQLDAPKTTDKPISDMFKMDNTRLLKIFEDYKVYKEKSDYVSPLFGIAGIVYDYMIELKGEFVTHERKVEIYKLAKAEYLQDQKRNGVPKAIVAQISKNMKDNISITNTAKRIAIEEFFTKLINQQKELKELL